MGPLADFLLANTCLLGYGNGEEWAGLAYDILDPIHFRLAKLAATRQRSKSAKTRTMGLSRIFCQTP